MIGDLMRKLPGLKPGDPLPEPEPSPVAEVGTGTVGIIPGMCQRDPHAIVFSYLAGRCANGAERDGGTLYHAVRGWRALCGAEPGRTSAGWSSHLGTTATRPRCLRKLARSERKANGTQDAGTSQA